MLDILQKNKDKLLCFLAKSLLFTNFKAFQCLIAMYKAYQHWAPAL